MCKERKQEGKIRCDKNHKETFNEMAVGTYVAIITLKVNGLNAAIKRHRVSEWMTKQDPTMCCLP